MNQQRQLLDTQRNPGLYTILGICFSWLPGVLIYTSFNKVIEHTHIKKVNILIALICIFHPIMAKRMNQELERRGLEYRISNFYTKGALSVIACLFLCSIPCIPLFWQMTMALNYLSKDYNING